MRSSLISCAFHAASRTFSRITTLSLCVSPRHQQLQTKTWEEDIKCALTFTTCDDPASVSWAQSDPSPASSEQKALPRNMADCGHTGKN